MVPAGGRQPSPHMLSPPQPPPSSDCAWGGQPSTTIWQDLICCTYMLASATYALHNGIPPCSSLLPKICPYNLFITYSCP